MGLSAVADLATCDDGIQWIYNVDAFSFEIIHFYRGEKENNTAITKSVGK